MKNKEATELIKEEVDIYEFELSKEDNQFELTGEEKEEVERHIKALRLAIQALEKQEPKEPTLEGDGYDDLGNIIYDTWICPNCESYYEVDYENYKYCPLCGQAIDWSGDDE